MGKFLYQKVKTADDYCWYAQLHLDAAECAFLKKHGVYCQPSGDGKYMVGIIQLKMMFS